jgi:carbonic anhydrase
MEKMSYQFALLFGSLSLLFSGCAPESPLVAGPVPDSQAEVGAVPRQQRVLTQAEQNALTPEDVLEVLRIGNERFVAGTLTTRNHSKQIRAAALGQYPKAVLLSCLDSRIPVEDVFDRGIGDIFVGRVAGNFENTDLLGSMEFACKVSGAKLVVVMGHEYCGAVRGAIDGVELGNITPMLENIHPAVAHFADYEGDKSGKNEEFVHMVAEQNVRMTVDDIREKSPILRKMETDGQIKIVGAMYDMNTGKVTFFEE